jgi:hypothetical protein
MLASRRRSITLANGESITKEDLEDYFRSSLCPNDGKVSMGTLVSFLSSIGFAATRQPDRIKIEVLTRDEVLYLTICQLKNDQGKETTHAINHLAIHRLLVDNAAFDQSLKISVSDIESLKPVKSKKTKRKIADGLIKMVLGDYTNEIQYWFNITPKATNSSHHPLGGISDSLESDPIQNLNDTSAVGAALELLS